ncbi:YcgN family cysteine cluster protein [Lichenihabitans psoromatis]|uniref:YcgN family cysteine cluster protein n=1 Tax=Lichenihabitans psoromatis TaxID=2528642 RepID=UPI0010385084|nr:YcgN family cysteine cluster protein [Lichenihabitans psoromatis]
MSDQQDEIAPASPEAEPFWRKPLEVMTTPEWESLCDGCGRCCLVKLEDEDTREVYFTEISCALLSKATCQCSDYPNRQSKIPDCVKLTPEIVRTIGWLPPTCAYRLVAEGRDLMWWHPLVSGRAETVDEAGVSVRGKVAASEDEVQIDDLPGYIVAWPTKVPARARKKGMAAGAKRPGGKLP